MRHGLLGILIIVASFFAAWLWSDYRDFADGAMRLPQQGIHYQLRSGTSVRALADDLHARGILRNGLYLRLLARVGGQAERLQAGEYFLAAGTTPRRLLQQLASGRVTNYSLTLVEGWNFRQIMQAVADNESFQHQLTAGLSDEQIMTRLGFPGEHPEGRFYPDTYRFPRNTTDIAFLQRAYRAMSARLQQEWSGRAPDLPLHSPYEALILASIVEKETAVPAERPEIAGVFIRRLRKKMKLQTDPTVIYGMGEAFTGNIRRRDLRRDTPYNTYVRSGLPPTPICMPGGDAIRAALHPAAGKSLYFVARGDGSHQFSDRLKDHNQAVQRFQLKK